jgi:DNA-binding response OmpR family regulator
MEEKKKHILVIDDSNTNLVLIHAILETKGLECATAGSVKEARVMIKKNKPDLILLDLLMPEVNGFDFLQEMRNDDELKTIPVIVVSALIGEDHEKHSKDLGAVEFIQKPIDIKSLVTKVTKILA